MFSLVMLCDGCALGLLIGTWLPDRQTAFLTAVIFVLIAAAIVVFWS
jgi:hypothetical protein